MTVESEFLPGNLVRARGREWVVQPGSSSKVLKLRPLGGSDDDISLILPALEKEPVKSAQFPMPDCETPGTHDAAIMMRDALLLKMRSGAGPFRSFGNIAVEPRAYQLVPMLMALKHPTVRILIADDVGIGKTIEAGLIVRELLDRGEITRAAVLCPPHLVEQWKSELKLRFNINAQDLTPSNVARIEKTLPPGVSLFEQYPFVIVSLDYIKSERHRDHFLNIAPECIVVDEAHTCTETGTKGKQLRYDLLKRLVGGENSDRHLIMLTATPHSGKDVSFYSLLALLDPKFAELQFAQGAKRDELRKLLAEHFVQRRRIDIDEWKDSSVFPRRKTAEVAYELSGDWRRFFDDVYDYCINMATKVEDRSKKAGQMIWYAILALLRCISSSPASAISALNTRLQGVSPESLTEDTITEDEEGRLYDDNDDSLPLNDLEPAATPDDKESADLNKLIDEAKKLMQNGDDPKLLALVNNLEKLIKEGFKPVIFCRYIATAEYVAYQLKHVFGDRIVVDCVSGNYTPEERKARVEALGVEEEKPVVLVATDCLSEGINLQDTFDAAIHYDLAWNPTRHEQREGRVDRFGQKSKEVRSLMIYGGDNPVDGFILKVILRKAETIRKDLGVMVPMPENRKVMDRAILKATLLKQQSQRDLNYKQGFLDFGGDDTDAELEQIDVEWQDAMEKAKANRTVFAQHRMKPEDVMPEWNRQLNALGGKDDVLRFVKNACARLNSPLTALMTKPGCFKIAPQHLPPAIKERLSMEGFAKPFNLEFTYPCSEHSVFIHRSHPLVSLLADYVLENALGSTQKRAARTAVTLTEDVNVVTTVFLLRLRHQLSYKRKGVTKVIMAEEMLSVAATGRSNPTWVCGEVCNKYLEVKPSANPSASVITKELNDASAMFLSNRSTIEEFAKQRANELLADHRRVREAAADRGSYEVKPCLPVDLIGIYVLLPDEL